MKKIWKKTCSRPGNTTWWARRHVETCRARRHAQTRPFAVAKRCIKAFLENSRSPSVSASKMDTKTRQILFLFFYFEDAKQTTGKKGEGGWKDQCVLHLFFARNYNKNNRTRENLSCVSRLLQCNNGGDEGGKEETGVLHKKMERPRFLFLLSLCLLWRERGFGGC